MAAFGSATTTILYVGSDGSVVERALPNLGEAGDAATVTTVSGVEETLTAVIEAGADCVVSEYDLPDGTATDLVRRLREEHPTLPVLVLAADAGDAAESVEAGATDSLTMDLATTSEELLAGRIEGALRYDDAAESGAVTGRQYRTLIEHAADIVTVIAPDGTIEYQSPSVERILDWGPDELVGEYAFNYIHPDDRDEMRGRFIDLTDQEGTVIEDVTFRFKRADGSWAWLESVGSNRKDTSVGGYVFNSREITERRERERELERYETVVEAIPDEVYTLDDEGILTSVVPPAGRDLTVAGYEPDELVGEPVSTVMEADDIETAEELIGELITGDGTRGSFEMDLITKPGDRIPFENHVSVLPSDDGFRGTVGVLRNIAERKEREQELQRQNERLERFASVVSHDLRNPLSVISGHAEVARDADDVEPHLDSIVESADRMGEIIDDVLVLTRGDEALTREPVAIAPNAREAWDHTDSGDATLAVTTDETVRANRSQLSQALENLFRNAVEHGSTSPPSQAQADTDGARSAEHGDDGLTVRVGSFTDDRASGIFVADDGTGIPTDDRERVLEDGFSTSEDGTGLGLSVVTDIAAGHGWDIRVTDSASNGARIELVTEQQSTSAVEPTSAE